MNSEKIRYQWVLQHERDVKPVISVRLNLPSEDYDVEEFDRLLDPCKFCPGIKILEHGPYYSPIEGIDLMAEFTDIPWITCSGCGRDSILPARIKDKISEVTRQLDARLSNIPQD